MDAVKVWVALQRYGADGLGALYDRLCATARGAPRSRSAARPDFEALHEPESNILCFRYLGDRSLDAPSARCLNLRLREEYNRSGAGWITTTMLGGRRVLRVTVMNPRTARADLETVVEGLARLGAGLVPAYRLPPSA